MDLKFPYGQQFFNTQILIAPIRIFLRQSGENLDISKTTDSVLFLEKPIWGYRHAIKIILKCLPGVKFHLSKVGRVFPMVVISVLPHAEF